MNFRSVSGSLTALRTFSLADGWLQVDLALASSDDAANRRVHMLQQRALTR